MLGKTCRTHYKGTLAAERFDSSCDHVGLEFVCGAGQMIKGFDTAVADMEVERDESYLMPRGSLACPNRACHSGTGNRSAASSRNWDLGRQVSLNQPDG